MKKILDTISHNYTNKMHTAYIREDFDAIEQYVDEKKVWENNIKAALTKTLTIQEKDGLEILQIFFEIEDKLLMEHNKEEKQQREWQLDATKNNILVYTRRYLISEENNKLPLFGIINEQKLREMTDMLFEDNYIIDGIFDEELRLDENYFFEEQEEYLKENPGEELNEENSARRSGEVTATISSPYLNGVWGDIKEKYNVERSEIATNIKKNIAKFADIFKDKPKIFISVFAERYTQEELKVVVEKYYPRMYYTQSLNKYITERYEEENN